MVIIDFKLILFLVDYKNDVIKHRILRISRTKQRKSKCIRNKRKYSYIEKVFIKNIIHKAIWQIEDEEFCHDGDKYSSSLDLEEIFDRIKTYEEKTESYRDGNNFETTRKRKKLENTESNSDGSNFETATKRRKLKEEMGFSKKAVLQCPN